MKKFWSVSFFAGILSVSCYLIFSLLAFEKYPLSLSPTANWLSDLGNPIYNPNGAIWYNIGIIATASLLLLFFIGLSVLDSKDKPRRLIILRVTQAIGIMGSLAMIVSGIFPINQFKIHAFWSTSLYVLLSTSFTLTSILLVISHRAPWWMLILGVSSSVLVILSGIFPATYLLEWITVLVLFACVILEGASVNRGAMPLIQV